MDGLADIPGQTLAAWAIVAVTALLLLRHGWRKLRAAGRTGSSSCGGGCGCSRSQGIPKPNHKKGV